MRHTVMSIVNVNDDSFSNDGTTNPREAVEIARRQIADGADIIDVGAESARTNRSAISTASEADRLCQFLDHWEEAAPLSINTWRPEVLRQVLPRGTFTSVNDISGLPTPENAELAAEHDCKLVIMHTVGQPKVPHTHQTYSDIWSTLLSFFEERVTLALKAGLKRESIILDPGIDFAKQTQDNLQIYKHLSRLDQFALPVLVPVSRKTVIGDVLDLSNPGDRDAGTLACISLTSGAGERIYRVHNTRAAVSSLLTLASFRTKD